MSSRNLNSAASKSWLRWVYSFCFKWTIYSKSKLQINFYWIILHLTNFQCVLSYYVKFQTSSQTSKLRFFFYHNISRSLIYILFCFVNPENAKLCKKNYIFVLFCFGNGSIKFVLTLLSWNKAVYITLTFFFNLKTQWNSTYLHTSFPCSTGW